MPALKLNQLDMLVAVADTGSFGGAAAQLGCTQSRISHAITQLEQHLGARMLLRSRSGCVPTAAGHRVLAQTRQILHLTGTLAALATEQGVVSGHVRIACFRSVATHLLAPALAALALDYPGIRVDLDDSHEEREQVTQAVIEGRAEIGIAQWPVSAELVSRPYVSDAYVLVAPAALRLQTPVSWDQLSHMPYIQLNCSGALAMLEQCRAAGFTAEPVRTVSTDSSIAAMVAQGLGYSILPRLAITPVPGGVQIADLPCAAQRRFVLVAAAGNARSKLVQTVLRIIADQRIVQHSPAFRAGLISRP